VPTSSNSETSLEQARLAAVREDGGMSRTPEGFGYVVRGDGEVQISHHGRPATVLRGAAAARFLVDLDGGDRQQLMARVTGNYKHGNERMGKNHPRNRAR
jgi:hypothetical protein